MGASTKTTSGAFPPLSTSTLTKVASDEWIERSLARLEVYEELRDEFKGKLEAVPEGDGQMVLLDLIVQLERRVAKLYRQLEVIAEAREGARASKEAQSEPAPQAQPTVQPKPSEKSGPQKTPAVQAVRPSHIPADLPPPPLAPGLDPNEIPPPPLRMADMAKRKPSGPHLASPPEWAADVPTASPDAVTRPESASWHISKLTRDKVSQTPSGTHSIQHTPEAGELVEGKPRKGRGERYRTMREVPQFKAGDESPQADKLQTASGGWKRPEADPKTPQATIPKLSTGAHAAVGQATPQPAITATPTQPPTGSWKRPELNQKPTQPAATPSPAASSAPSTQGPATGSWQRPQPTQPVAGVPGTPTTGSWQRPQAQPAPAHTQKPVANPLNQTRAGHPANAPASPRNPFSAPYAGNPLNRPNASPVNNPLNQAQLDPHPAAFPAVNNPLNNPLNAVRRAGTSSAATPRLGQPFPFRAVASEYDERGSKWAQTETFEDDDIDFPTSSRGLWFFVFLLFAAAGAGGYYWYTHGGRAFLQPAAATPETTAPAAPPRVIKARPVLPDTQGPAVKDGGSVDQSRGTTFKKRKYRGRAGGGSISSSVEPGDDAIDADSIRKSDPSTKVVKTDDPFEGADQ